MSGAAEGSRGGSQARRPGLLFHRDGGGTKGDEGERDKASCRSLPALLTCVTCTTFHFLRSLTSVRRVSHPSSPSNPEAVSHRTDFEAGRFIIYQKKARLFPSDSVIALPSPNAADAAPSASAAEDGGGLERDGGEPEGEVRRVFLETCQLPHPGPLGLSVLLITG